MAVDWSGAAGGRLRGLWLATAEDGRLLDLHPAGTREAAVAEVIDGAEVAGGQLVVGLDFAFSFPAWFVRRQGIGDATGMWRLAAAEGERWLAECPEPFWGRPGHRRPAVPAALRATEAALEAVGGIRPKSAFQIGGAGAVGTGSVRGMPFLIELQAAGFAVWPFDRAVAPLVVEIYPRLLTGPVRKRDPAARRRYLAELPDAAAPPELRDRAAGSEDAFDAAVSALVMSGPAGQWAALAVPDLPDVALEGAIWSPTSGHPTPLEPAGGVAVPDPGSLADRLAIAELVARYAQGADRADGEAVAELFTEDGVLVVDDRPGVSPPRPARRGRPAIAAAIGTLARYRATSHVLGNHTVELAGDRATGEVRAVATHLGEGPEGPRLEAWHLRYFDRYRRRQGRWWLAERRLQVDFIVSTPPGGAT